jgi:tetratricopeptide (TPR) repeat protein
MKKALSVLACAFTLAAFPAQAGPSASSAAQAARANPATPANPGADPDAGCRHLELRAPQSANGGLREVPLFLAYPDTLGPLAVGAFLLAPAEKAAAMIKQADWQIQSLSPLERKALQALRDLVDGRAREAGEGLAAVLPKASARLKPILKIDRALILFLAGFPDDAERDWRGLSRPGSGCAEIAMRNLFSLYLARGRLDSAQTMVDAALKANPRHKWANASNGYLLQMRSTDEEWERYLREKSEVQDSLFDIQLAYARHLKGQKRFEEAVRYYNRGLEGAPGNGPAWLELADTYYRMGLSFLAQASLDKCFAAGIRDPYVYELLGLVLVDMSSYAAQGKTLQDWRWGVLDMRDLHWGLDPSWADRCWRMAERNLESGLGHDLQSRSMTQLLYHLYSHNGKTEAANNLREDFWFHFTGPRIPRQINLIGPDTPPTSWLRIRLGQVSGPLVFAAGRSDFFEPF